MANIKGHHKCPACGQEGSFTITDLDEQICDLCETPVSIGSPVKRLRAKLYNESVVDKQLKSGMGNLDGNGVLHSNSLNDMQRMFLIALNLLSMLKETMLMLEDNGLMVGDNKAETQEYIDKSVEELNSIKNKYT